MNRWTTLSAVLAVALTASAGVAQTNEELSRQMEELKATVQSLAKSQQALAAENAELKAQVAGDSLETEINRLSERLAANTIVKSEASCIKMGGEFRFRSYWSFGDNSSIVDPGNKTEGTDFEGSEHDGSWTDARVRLNFMYDFTKDVTAFAELQSHWAFGQDSTGPIDDYNGNDSSGNVRMHQAWIEVRNVFCRPEFSTKLGRQELVFGHQFQLGNADWYNGVVFDGSRWDWNSECWSLTGLMFKLSSNDGDINQYPSFQGSHDDDELYGLYFTLKSIKNHKLDLYWLYVNGHGGSSVNSGANAGFGSNADLGGTGITGFLYPTSTAYFHTVGARIGGWWDIACGLDWNLEAAYQFGDAKVGGPGADFDVDSLAVEGEIGVTFSKTSRFRIYTRALYAEGPDDEDVGYLTLFPNRHSHTASFGARHGLADVIPMSNVFTAQLGLHFDPWQNWTLGATGLWATSDEQGSNGFISGGAGDDDDDDYCWEIDVYGAWRYSDQLTFSAGIAFVFPEDQGEFLWGVDDETQFIGYLQARLWF